MPKSLIAILLVLCTAISYAQSIDSTGAVLNKSSASFILSPQYPGGQGAFRKFLSKNLRYPSSAIEHRASGKVFVAFMVETDGTLSSIVTNKDNYGLAKEAIRVMKLSPKWQPGVSNNNLSKMRYSFSLDFIIIRDGFVTVDINLPDNL